MGWLFSNHKACDTVYIVEVKRCEIENGVRKPRREAGHSAAVFCCAKLSPKRNGFVSKTGKDVISVQKNKTDNTAFIRKTYNSLKLRPGPLTGRKRRCTMCLRQRNW